MSQSKSLVKNFLAFFAKILVQKMLGYVQVLTKILVFICYTDPNNTKPNH